MIMQAGIVNNTVTTMFKIGNVGKEVCDQCGGATKAGSKNGIQKSLENICKIFLAILI